MRARRFRFLWLMLFCVLAVFGQAVFGQRSADPPLVRSWTIREVGNFKKIPTATLREKMVQRGVLFGVNEPFDQNKADGTTLLLRQLYKDAGVPVTVREMTLPAGKNSVKVEYVINRQ